MNIQDGSEDVQFLQAKINASIAESEDADLLKVGRSGSHMMGAGPRKLTLAVATQSSGGNRGSQLLS